MQRIKLTFPVIGLSIGYFLLHPVSMLIMGRELSLIPVFKSFSFAHLDMAFYFSLIGVIFGGVVAFLQVKILIQKKEVSDKNASLRQAVIEKESLLRILSHDLINLIGTGKMLLEFMLEKPELLSVAKTADWNSRIIRCLSEACNLIDVSRQLSAIESGMIDMDIVKCEIVRLVKESGAIFQSSCSNKNISIVFSMPDHPLVAKTEPTIFKHTIIGNLMSNAIKFSDEGQTIHVKLEKKGERVEIAISNTGPEITPERQNILFSVSTKTSTVGTTGEKGSGFGLPLVYKFVRLMEGTISMESKPHKKLSNRHVNTFKIELPLD